MFEYRKAIEKAYYVGGVYAQGSLPFNKNHALTCATEWIWNRASKHELRDLVVTSPLNISLLVGHELRYGKFLLGAQIGTDLINNALRFGEVLPMRHIHMRGGLCYRITDYFFVGVGLNIRAFLELGAKKEGKMMDRDGAKKEAKKMMDRDEVKMMKRKRDYIDFRIGYSF